jgi:hemoglobin
MPPLTKAGHLRRLSLTAEPTPFERIGGADVVDALVERFYAEMDARPEARGVRALHAANLAPTKFVLKRYLGEWLGGPPLYSRDRGHPRLRMRHLRFPIGAAERDAWLACMRAALEATIADPQARAPIFEAMASLADHMRNRPPDEGDREERRLPAG